MFTKALFSFLIAMLSAGVLTAESDFNKINFSKETLDNGLQVIYHVDKSAPVVATVMHYRVGSCNESEGQKGYAHFFEHLMFEATDDIKRATIDKYVEEAGGVLNAATSFNQTVYFFKVPANEIKLPLWIESQRMRRLHVDSIGVETQRGVVLEEMKQRTGNTPYGQLLKKICNVGFAGSCYSWPTIGTAEDIKNAKIQDFKNFYDKYYVPSNATLVISGDINVADARQYVHDYFDSYPAMDEPVKKVAPVTPISKQTNEDIEDEKARLPGVFIGYRGPSLKDSTYYATQLMISILADGKSSRLNRKLVEEEEAAVQASVLPLSLQYGGVIMLIGICQMDKSIKNVENLIHEEIDRLIEDGITDEEYNKARNIMEADFVTGKKDVLSKAKSLAKYNSYFNDPGLINTELDNYMNVTKQDIVNAAKKYLATDKTFTFFFLPKGYDKK